MHFTDILPIISAVFVLILGLIVFSKNKKSRINFTFFLFTLAICVWLFGTSMMFISRNNREFAIFWDRFVYAGVVFIPILMYHFGLAFMNKKRNWLLYLGYTLSFLFLISTRTPYFVDGTFTYKWGIHTKAKLFHHIFLIYFAVYVVIWFYKIYHFYKDIKSSSDKLQTKYIFIGFLFLFTLGPVAYLPAYGFGIYPFAYFSGLIFTIILSYAIIKHHLMDIKLVLRKYTVLLLSIITILIPAILIQYLFILYAKKFTNWADVLILVISISTYPSLKNYFYRLANKYFFSSLYDSREVISNISNKLRTTLDINKIYEFIDETLDDAFHYKAFGVLTYNPKRKIYTLEYNNGLETKGKKKFPGNDKLHKIFISQNRNIITEEVKNRYYNKNTKDTIDLLSDLKIEVLSPLNIKDKTVGLIALGQKESSDMYNDEDLQVMGVVNSQAAIAIENAMLYKETLNFNVKLKKEVEKRTRELKLANTKLKQLDKAKSEFISIASHQLRTPLTVIKGYISMMLEGNFGELDMAKQESLEKVYLSNERLIQLVENLLNISRIESGRLQFNYEVMQFEDLVNSVVDELTEHAKKKGLKLIYKKTTKKLPKVRIDQEKLRQVVMNLIDNAIKYTKKGTVTVNLKLSKGNIDFCVSDSGMGIDPMDLPNLFKKFSRGTGSSVVHTEGTGLGLYVAEQMIRYHKGKIWAESKGVNKGSKFCFLLPVYKK